MIKRKIGAAEFMRMIDADALIEEIKKQAGCATCNHYNHVKCRTCNYDDIISIVDDFGDNQARRYREFWTLTIDEIKEIATNILEAEKVTCVKKHGKNEDAYYSLKIYTIWECDDDDGKKAYTRAADIINLRDPWIYGTNAIDWECASEKDFAEYKRYLYAKGICVYNKDNKWLDIGD